MIDKIWYRVQVRRPSTGTSLTAWVKAVSGTDAAMRSGLWDMYRDIGWQGAFRPATPQEALECGGN